MAEFNIKKLIQAAFFDYIGPEFPDFAFKSPGILPPDVNNLSVELVNGSRYFMDLRLQDGDGRIYTLPNEPLVRFTENKTIVETPTVGERRRGTVKEYITTNDVEISVRGLCYDPDAPEYYPNRQVQEVQDLFKRNETLTVVGNKLFEIMGVRNVVIKDKDFDEMPGQHQMQKYELLLISDEDFFADLDERDQFLTS